jgi:hypothetical protein
MVEAQGSIGQRIDGNVGLFATDSTVEKALRLGPSIMSWRMTLASESGDRIEG